MEADLSIGAAAAARARARVARQRSSILRSACLAQHRRAEQIADRLAETLSRGGVRALGDRGDSFLLELASLRPMVRLARNDLRRWLQHSGLPGQIISEVTLACSEACANAIEHPEQASRKRIALEAHRRGKDLEIRVRDFGSWKQSAHTDTRGRGLSMISDLMDSVDLRRAPTGSELVMRRSIFAANGGEQIRARPNIGDDGGA